MLILGVDVETTGVDYEEDRITEIGAVLYDWDDKSIVGVMSKLVLEDPKPPQSDLIIEITGITDDMLKKWGEPPRDVMNEFLNMYYNADYLVAHNVDFDKTMLKNFILRNFPAWEPGPPKIWLDTSKDLPLPQSCRHTNLTYLSGFHGFANPFSHRAVTDVLTMLKLLEKFDIEEVIKINASPTVKFKANVDFHDKDLAKQEGFKWTPTPPSIKGWYKEVKECFLDMEKVEDGSFFGFNYTWEKL